jgi:hypothetical protein
MLEKIKKTIIENINIYQSSGFGLYISWGRNYERRRYFTVEVPFLMFQFFLDKK